MSSKRRGGRFTPPKRRRQEGGAPAPETEEDTVQGLQQAGLAICAVAKVAGVDDPLDVFGTAAENVDPNPPAWAIAAARAYQERGCPTCPHRTPEDDQRLSWLLPTDLVARCTPCNLNATAAISGGPEDHTCDACGLVVEVLMYCPVIVGNLIVAACLCESCYKLRLKTRTA